MATASVTAAFVSLLNTYRCFCRTVRRAVEHPGVGYDAAMDKDGQGSGGVRMKRASADGGGSVSV